jgi:hypothetical protein
MEKDATENETKGKAFRDSFAKEKGVKTSKTTFGFVLSSVFFHFLLSCGLHACFKGLQSLFDLLVLSVTALPKRRA